MDFHGKADVIALVFGIIVISVAVATILRFYVSGMTVEPKGELSCTAKASAV